MRTRALSLASAALALAALAPLPAHAQPARPDAPAARTEGTVVRIDEGLFVVDLGRATGVGTGSTYTVYRPLTVRHPLTGRVLRDRFPIGTIVLEHAGDALSVGRPRERLSRPVMVGDVVVPEAVVPVALPSRPLPPSPSRAAPAPRAAPATDVIAAPAPPQPPVTPRLPPPPPPPAAQSTEERALLAAFIDTLSQPPEARIARYERYLAEHPASPFAPAVRAELVTLLQSAVAAPPGGPHGSGPNLSVEDLAPTSLRTGEPAVIAVQFEPESPIVEGALYYRRVGASTYDRVAARVEGDGYLRAEIPPAMVTPGGFEYFVEVALPDGHTAPVVARASAPRRVEVLPPPQAPPPLTGRTRIDLRGEYADVGTRTIGGVQRVQRFFVVEGDFLQRLEPRWLYGYRVGFGVYDGDALPLAQLTSMTPTVHTRVIYGYHELEFAPSDFVHLIARVQVGVFQSGLVFGAQARVRMGNERRTNIVLGGDLLGEVGQRAFFAFNFAPLDRLPMMAQGEVFNQSVAVGDPMFRFIAQAGWRFAPWLTVSLRGSYQLRNIENGGFGVGLNTTFDW